MATQQPQSEVVYDVQVNFRIPQALYDSLDLVRQRKDTRFTMSDIYREAFRAYVDKQEDIIGSRAHFQKSLRDHIDEFEKRLFQLQAQQTQHFEAALGNLAHAILQRGTTPADPKGDLNIDSKTVSLIILELHAMFRLQALAFAKLFSRVLPQDKDLADFNALIETNITYAQAESKLFDARFRLTQENVDPEDVDIDKLLHGDS